MKSKNPGHKDDIRIEAKKIFAWRVKRHSDEIRYQTKLKLEIVLSIDKMNKTKKVYGIFEKESGELVYIGKTRSSLEQRWFYHTWKDNWSTSPIRKYMESKGFEYFEISLLYTCETEQDLDDWEKHFILECEPRFNKKLWSGWYTS